MSDKTYINGLSIKEKKFNDGSILNIGINVDVLIEQLQQLRNDKGYVNITVKQRREVGKYGETHYAELNTWTKEDKPLPTNVPGDIGYNNPSTEDDGLPW